MRSKKKEELTKQLDDLKVRFGPFSARFDLDLASKMTKFVVHFSKIEFASFGSFVTRMVEFVNNLVTNH